MDFAELAGGTVVGGAGLFGVIYLVVKNLAAKAVDDAFAKGLEDHKAELQRGLKAHEAELDRQVNTAVARLQANLDVETKRLTDYEKRQGEVLSEFYPRLWSVARSAAGLSEACWSGRGEVSDRLEDLDALESQLRKFVVDIHLKAVFLPEELESAIRGALVTALKQVHRLKEEEAAGASFHDRDAQTLLDSNEIDAVTKEVKDSVRRLMSQRVDSSSK